MGKIAEKEVKSGAAEVKQQEGAKKIRPFNVMDQMVAHRLAMEGFEILNVVPSNKYADEAHFIFSFNSSSAFRKRFKEVLEEVERKNAEAENARKSAEDARIAEVTADLNAEIERLNAENLEIKGKICEKTAKNVRNLPDFCEKISNFDEKQAENGQKEGSFEKKCEKCADYRSHEILDKLAELEALGNCILSNVSALGFYERVFKAAEKE